MANHAGIKTTGEIDPIVLEKRVREIVSIKLKGLFEVESKIYTTGHISFFVFYKNDPDNISLQFWTSDEWDYSDTPHIEPRKVASRNIIEFRHGHTFDFMWWVEGVIRETLGEIYQGEMWDDGCDISPTPKPQKYETFERFCAGNKKFWLNRHQKKHIPLDLIKGLNLDF